VSFRHEKTDPLLGVVLAGGRSRRMGRDKAGLDWLGQTWLDCARTVLTAANAGRIAVLGRPDLTDGVPDLAPGDGPAVNLAGFMARLPAGTRLMVVPVDMPTLDPAVLRLLAVQARGGVPRGKILPAALTVPAGPVAPRGNALRDLWAALDLTEIDLPSDLSLANINTPEDLSVLAAEAAPWT